MWLIVTFALIALLWSVFGRIDVVAVAHGKIIPNDRSKVIQPVETAAVRAIRVAEGQAVRAGDVLIELDATYADADRTRFGNDALTARAQAARARSMLAALDGRGTRLVPIQGADAARQAQEQRQVDGQWAEHQARLARIDADIARRSAEMESTREIVRKLEQTAPIARQRAEDFRNLVDKNFISRHGYLEKEQARIEQEADLATQSGRLKELGAAIAEARSQRNAMIAESRRIALESLNDAEQKSVAFSQEHLKADSRREQMRLTAPVDGTVQQLAVHTIGGVVTPAQALMVIVPNDNPLEIEAVLDNKDIGFVNAGQDAEIKIETFPFTRYGTLRGRVTNVSGDAIADEKRGLFFSARVSLEQTHLQVDDKLVRLQPGMAVTVEVKTGTRRVIEYFTSPLLQAKDESLRER
jgi:hemolysin D